MKKLIASLMLLIATCASAQHVDIRAGSNTQAVSISSGPVYHFLGMPIDIEGGVQRWRENGQTGNQIYVTPVFRFPITGSLAFDFGVGVSVFDRTKYGDKDISTPFQFSDHVGITYSTMSFAVGVRYVHASNAGIQRPNPGMDSVQAALSIAF